MASGVVWWIEGVREEVILNGREKEKREERGDLRRREEREVSERGREERVSANVRFTVSVCPHMHHHMLDSGGSYGSSQQKT